MPASVRVRGRRLANEETIHFGGISTQKEYIKGGKQTLFRPNLEILWFGRNFFDVSEDEFSRKQKLFRPNGQNG